MNFWNFMLRLKTTLTLSLHARSNEVQREAGDLTAGVGQCAASQQNH